jgi:RNA polymerase sigma-70 factor (ECF subfamily)
MHMSFVHSDAALVDRVLAGDDSAFRELFDANFAKLYRFALVRLHGNRDEATDAVQQTFCKAFEHLHSYRGEASLFGWLCQICRNVITDRARRLVRETTHVQLLEDDAAIRGILESVAAPSGDEPERQAVRGEVVRLIQATLDSLPQRYGDVLEWKYVDGLSVKQIAQRLGTAPKAAESMLTRAREAFRETVHAIDASADLVSTFAIPVKTVPVVKK